MKTIVARFTLVCIILIVISRIFPGQSFADIDPKIIAGPVVPLDHAFELPFVLFAGQRTARSILHNLEITLHFVEGFKVVRMQWTDEQPVGLEDDGHVLCL